TDDDVDAVGQLDAIADFFHHHLAQLRHRFIADEEALDVVQRDGGLVAVTGKAEDGATLTTSQRRQGDAANGATLAVKHGRDVGDDQRRDRVLAASAATDNPQLAHPLLRRLALGDLAEEVQLLSGHRYGEGTLENGAPAHPGFAGKPLG